MVDPSEASGEIVLYTTEDGLARVQLRAVDGTAWLAQKEIAELFDKDVRTINEHIQNVIADHEIDPAATVRQFRIVRTEGDREVSRAVAHYNIDAILAVGYRVRSARGTQFRRWATTVLADYLVKGFAMDDAKLKDSGKWDYFEEWLERIRDIRASEKRFYQKVRDLYITAVDYQSSSDEAQQFFAKVQNKMLWAVSGCTAAELIASRSDSNAANMGLSSWTGSIVRKGDVSTGKNYLSSEEVAELNRIVTMYLDYAEDQAERRQTVTMQQWSDKLDAFLVFNDRGLLRGAGGMKATVAKKLAEGRYDNFDAKRRRAATETADAADFAALEALGKDEE